MSEQQGSRWTRERRLKRVLIVVGVLVLAIWLLLTGNRSSQHPPAKAASTSSTTSTVATDGAGPPAGAASSELDPDHRYCAQQVLSDQAGQVAQPPLRCFGTADLALATATGSCAGCVPHWLLGIDYRDTHNQGDQLYWYATSSCTSHRFLAPVPASWSDRISSARPPPNPGPDRCGHWIHSDSTVSLDCGYLSSRPSQPPCRNLDLPGGGSMNDRTSIEEWH